jgi:DNA-directed RNA polymerase specialized sigma subunit
MSVLERALRTFDPHRGASFGTYLISIVHNAMFDATALRKHCTVVPQAMVSKHRKVRRAIAALEEGEEPWRAAEADAVAEVAGLRVADVAACMNGLLNFREHSFEALHPSSAFPSLLSTYCRHCSIHRDALRFFRGSFFSILG